MKIACTCVSTVFGLRWSLRADAGVGAALGHQLEHAALALGQRRERVVGTRAAEQLSDHGRIHRRAAARNALERVDEVVHVERHGP